MKTIFMPSRLLHLFLMVLCLSLIVLAGRHVHAMTGSSIDDDTLRLPPDLQPWHDWVMYRQTFHECPLQYGAQGKNPNDYLCAWPGRLYFEVDAAGASIRQTWRVDSESWVPLPGNERYWPQNVMVDGEAQPVLKNNGDPSLFLQPGSYEISAYIPWQERPQSIPIPPAIVLVSLIVDGKPVHPVQNKNGALILGRTISAVSQEADNLEVHVFRQLSDDIPAILTTEIRLFVSGKAREFALGPVLPEHFAPMSISSPWPARLDAEGRLHLQARPGETTISLQARATEPLDAVTARLPGKDWVAQEVWSYASKPNLRVTVMTPATTDPVAIPVDPKQAQVPPAWESQPAFAVRNGSVLRIEERSRGLSDDANRLSLQREMWLAFDGRSLFARDHLRGQMKKDWRLDVMPPYRLERANHGDKDYNMPFLVTNSPDSTGRTGIEWHSAQVDVVAGVSLADLPAVPGAFASIPFAALMPQLPISGWQQTLDEITTTLHLPYGYHLVAAPGAETDETWLNRWSWSSIFFAAFTVLLAWHLAGFSFAAISAVFLVVSMPFSNLLIAGLSWWPLVGTLFIAIAVHLLLRERNGLNALRCKQLIVLPFLLLALPFAAYQLMIAAYPQLDLTTAAFKLGAIDEKAAKLELPKPPPPPSAAKSQDVLEQSVAMSPAPKQALPRRVPSTSKITPTEDTDNLIEAYRHINQPVSFGTAMQNRYNQSTVVQTGRGEPDWKYIGTVYSLHWAGPIPPDQSIRLIISPRWLTALLRIVAMLLLGWIAWKLIRRAFPGTRTPSENRTSAGASPNAADAKQQPVIPTVAAMIVAALIATAPTDAYAEAFPSPELLKEMQERLTEAPRCAPNCVSIPNANIEAGPTELKITLEAHAGGLVALPVPAGIQNLELIRVTLDGENETEVLSTSSNANAVIALERGVHHVDFVYAINGESASLHFRLQPGQVQFTSRTWQTDAIDEGRLLNSTVNLTKLEAAKADRNETKTDTAAEQFPPFVQVVREISFDQDWTSETLVRRLAPANSGITVSIPLMEGEHVTTPGIKVGTGQVTASIGSHTQLLRWESRLDKSKTLRLIAPPAGERAEVWRIAANPIWHIKWQGVPALLPPSTRHEQIFEFHPLPSETLTLEVAEPQAAEGALLAIDNADLSMKIEPRAVHYRLSFSLRANRGGEHTITLPGDRFEVLSVEIDRHDNESRPVDGKLTLPVVPGKQTITLEAHEQGEPQIRMSTPKIDLGLPAANISLSIEPPAKRWLLATSGPALGPVLLQWSLLAVALILAALLAKTRLTGLKPHVLLLAALGLSFISWTALVFLAVWLMIIEWRRRAVPLIGWSPGSFNLMHIGLIGLTAVTALQLVFSLPSGLTDIPRMVVPDIRSILDGDGLNWFVDQGGPVLPSAGIVSVPAWVYQALMLLWTLWFVIVAAGWLKNAYGIFKIEPWRRREKKMEYHPGQQ